MGQPTPRIGVVSNVFVRQMEFAKAGDVEIGHKHAYDHMTLLAKGEIQVRIGDQISVFKAPMLILIRADQEHELTALVDETVVYCVHGLRGDDKSDDLIDPAMVPRGPALRQFLKQVVVE